MNQYKGACICGACQYVINAEKPNAMFLCHCSRCRKETGTIHASTMFFDKAQLKWEKGEDNITYFHLENTRKQRAFCKTCGCPLPKYFMENHVMLPAGSLDEDTIIEPTAHIFHASRASWEDKTKDLKRFDELPT